MGEEPATKPVQSGGRGDLLIPLPVFAVAVPLGLGYVKYFILEAD